MRDSTAFKVLAVSENANSFGLRQILIVSQQGDAYAIHRHDPPDKGSVLRLPVVGGMVASTIGYHFECPTKLTKPPQSVIDELWTSRPTTSCSKEN